MIPEEVIRTVREVANIRQVVGEFVPLRQAGRNWVGLCPFHPDKDPSFSVNEEREAYYCFGCGEGGNVFKFLMKMQGLSFVEAVKTLASRYGIAVPERPLSPREIEGRNEREALLEPNEAAARFYHKTFLEAPEAAKARDYLSGRGLSGEMIRRFRLGWAPDRWDALCNHLRDLGLSLDVAEKAGLLVRRPGGEGHYDRFRARVVFPICDLSGRVVALGGRLLGDGHPKYLNSPETAVYHKGRILYGFHENLEDIRRGRGGFVVEGYMDLLALVQAGVHTAVATLGTALTAEHVQALRRYAKDWVLVFDGDAAGTRAALRTLPLFFHVALQPRVLTLPETDDPDTFIRRQGRTAWDAAVLTARPGLDFALDQGLESHGRDHEGKALTVEALLPLLQAVADPVRQSLMVSHVAQRLGLREEGLWQQVSAQGPAARPVRSVVKGGSANPQGEKAPNLHNKAEGQLIGFLLGHPQYIESFTQLGLDFWLEDLLLRDIWQGMLHLHEVTGRIELSALLATLEETTKAVASQLAKSVPPCERQDAMMTGLLRYCEERRRKTLRRQLLEEIRTGEAPDEEGCLRRLQRLR